MLAAEALTLAPLWYVAFLLSLTCHEAAHALAALRGGDDTAFRGGQVSLNPLPHIQREPFGTILVPIVSLALGGWMIGWASAPYNPYWQQRYPHRAARMALAGPLANLALAAAAALLIHVGIASGAFAVPEAINFQRVVDSRGAGWAEGAATFISILFSQNVLLFTFNLLPVPPLDGATAIGLLVPEEQALKIQQFLRDPTFSLAGLLLAWYFFGRVFWPIFGFAIQTLYPGQGFG